MNKTLVVALLLLIISGCGFSVKKAYTGPEREITELSVINCSFGVTIKSIDDNTKYKGSNHQCDYAVLPGIHRVTMTYYTNDGSGTGAWVYKDLHTIEFETIAGYEYSIAAHMRDAVWDMKVMSASMEKGADGKSKYLSWVDYKEIK